MNLWEHVADFSSVESIRITNMSNAMELISGAFYEKFLCFRGLSNSYNTESYPLMGYYKPFVLLNTGNYPKWIYNNSLYNLSFHNFYADYYYYDLMDKYISISEFNDSMSTVKTFIPKRVDSYVVISGGGNYASYNWGFLNAFKEDMFEDWKTSFALNVYYHNYAEQQYFPIWTEEDVFEALGISSWAVDSFNSLRLNKMPVEWVKQMYDVIKITGTKQLLGGVFSVVSGTYTSSCILNISLLPVAAIPYPEYWNDGVYHRAEFDESIGFPMDVEVWLYRPYYEEHHVVGNPYGYWTKIGNYSFDDFSSIPCTVRMTVDDTHGEKYNMSVWVICDYSRRLRYYPADNDEGKITKTVTANGNNTVTRWTTAFNRMYYQQELDANCNLIASETFYDFNQSKRKITVNTIYTQETKTITTVTRNDSFIFYGNQYNGYSESKQDVMTGILNNDMLKIVSYNITKYKNTDGTLYNVTEYQTTATYVNGVRHDTYDFDLTYTEPV